MHFYAKTKVKHKTWSIQMTAVSCINIELILYQKIKFPPEIQQLYTGQ